MGKLKINLALGEETNSVCDLRQQQANVSCHAVFIHFWRPRHKISPFGVTQDINWVSTRHQPGSLCEVWVSSMRLIPFMSCLVSSTDCCCPDRITLKLVTCYVWCDYGVCSLRTTRWIHNELNSMLQTYMFDCSLPVLSTLRSETAY